MGRIRNQTSKVENIYRARILNPISKSKYEEFEDGAIAVDDRGRIADCGRYSDVVKSYGENSRIQNFADRIIIPGLIDCHLHMPQLDQRGKHGATLFDWLKKYIFPSEVAFKDISIVRDVAKRFFKKLILNGTTTSSVYTTIHAKSTDLAFEIAKDTGLRIVMGKVMMDQNSPQYLLEPTTQSIDESVKLYEKWHGAANGKLFYSFTPRFGPTCSEKMWKEIGKLMSKTEAYLQTHISETVAEVENVRELFPDYADYTDLMEKNSCLTPKTLLAHVIYVSKSECERIARSGAKIVHCPTSNFFLKSGRMPVELIDAAGIDFGLGTDIGAGTSMSLFTCMRHADYIQPKINVTPGAAFYLATLGGAKVLSMDSEIGNFEQGKKADFCVVDIRGIDPSYKHSDFLADEILSLLMYRGDGDVIKETYVDGKKLDVDDIVLG